MSAYSRRAAEISQKSKGIGFKVVVGSLRLDDEGKTAVPDCNACAAIGDLVIPLGAPRDMDLLHTDSSFDELCPPIGQPQRKLMSRTAHRKTLATGIP